MKKTELKAIEQALDNEIKSTEQKIVEYSLLCQPIAPENSIGRVSRMDAINNKSIVEAALREAKKKIFELKEMKILINKEDFGICRKCNKEIPFGRLQIQPQSKFCVICA
jgi:DnaK suppressor protein